MKSLILKDWYNIKHNVKMMLIMLIFMAVCIMPAGGVEGYVVACALICSMMTVTTFSFDENCKWEKYAMVMPVSRRDYVVSKYLIHLLFGGVGLVCGSAGAILVGMIKNSLSVEALIGCVFAGAMLVVVSGSLFIPLIVRFGAENARIVLMGSVAAPALLGFVLYKLAAALHIVLTQQMLPALLGAGVLFIIVLALVSFRLSIKWFSQKEF